MRKGRAWPLWDIACGLYSAAAQTAALGLASGGGDRLQFQQYLLERRGQDNYVRRASDGEVVYTTSVADTSEGSDTDATVQGDEEFFHGCLWTFRCELSMCEGGTCGEAYIMAHDLQRRLLAFYRDRHGPAAPPLEEVTWLTLGTREEQRRELADSCPGLMVTSLLLVAEALAFAGRAEAERYAREAELYAVSLQRQAPRQFEVMLEMFPVREAWEGQGLARGLGGSEEGVPARPSHPPSVDIVVAGCSSSLQWLWELEYPAQSRVLVYDKCQRSTQDFEAQTVGLFGVVRTVEHRPVQESGAEGFMTGECTAYLTHVIGALESNTLADYTIFLHDDAPRHIRLSLLSLVLDGMRNAAYEVPFLHLVHERYPAFRTRCLRDVYRRVFGEELPGMLSTYCCAHFVVGKERIQARPVAFFKDILELVSVAPYARKHGGECNIGTKPCYVMEFLWHRIFGEHDELPPRSEHSSLPLALRYEGGRTSQLPSPLKIAPYMALFQPTRYSKLLEQSR